MLLEKRHLRRIQKYIGILWESVTRETPPEEDSGTHRHLPLARRKNTYSWEYVQFVKKSFSHHGHSKPQPKDGSQWLLVNSFSLGRPREAVKRPLEVPE